MNILGLISQLIGIKTLRLTVLLSNEIERCHLCNVVVYDSNHNTSLVYVLCIVIL